MSGPFAASLVLLPDRAAEGGRCGGCLRGTIELRPSTGEVEFRRDRRVEDESSGHSCFAKRHRCVEAGRWNSAAYAWMVVQLRGVGEDWIIYYFSSAEEAN